MFIQSFNPPTHTLSFVAHLEKGDELPMGLAQDVAVLGELVASHAERRQPQPQLHLNPQLCPCLQPNICLCGFASSIVAIVDAIPAVAHCITWPAGLLLLPLSESVDHSNCHPQLIVGDVRMQDKGPCSSQHHPQQHLIVMIIILLEDDVVGLDEEAGNMGSLHVH